MYFPNHDDVLYMFSYETVVTKTSSGRFNCMLEMALKKKKKKKISSQLQPTYVGKAIYRC